MTFSARPLRLSTTDATFEAQFAKRLHWSAETDTQVESMEALELEPYELKNAYHGLPSAQREALQSAASRVRAYHVAQKRATGESWSYRDEDGTLLGQKVTP